MKNHKINLLGEKISKNPLLRDVFIMPPFSVMNAREGNWQRRKKQWIKLGIRSEIGRDAATSGSKMVSDYKGGKRNTGLVVESDTSVFDPVVCELMYKWFCLIGGKIFDPFAGGSVRGVVANYLGYRYTGIDLSEHQIKANRTQAKEILKGKKPKWIVGDSTDCLSSAKGKYDFIFSCPPYGNLEIYSDDEKDLSTLTYPEFVKSYRKIIKRSVKMLKQNRFACFVVANIRDKKTGFYNPLVSDTIKAFQKAGALYYNEGILVTAMGSLPIRIGKQFKSGRKLGKTHQNILIFYKGDPKKIRENFKEITKQKIRKEKNVNSK